MAAKGKKKKKNSWAKPLKASGNQVMQPETNNSNTWNEQWPAQGGPIQPADTTPQWSTQGANGNVSNNSWANVVGAGSTQVVQQNTSSTSASTSQGTWDDPWGLSTAPAQPVGNTPHWDVMETLKQSKLTPEEREAERLEGELAAKKAAVDQKLKGWPWKGVSRKLVTMVSGCHIVK